MPRPTVCFSYLLVLIGSLPPLAGCAALPAASPQPPDVHAESAERKEATAREFEQKRDLAQYQAALARFQQNDTPGCQKTLQDLLQRSPQHYEARLLRAELMLLAGELQQTKEQLEELLNERPEDAAARHMAGLLLEAQDNLPGAVGQYEQAVRFAPENQAYRTTLQVAQETLTDRKTGGGDGITRVSANLPVDSTGSTSAPRQTASRRRGASVAGSALEQALQANDQQAIDEHVAAVAVTATDDPQAVIAAAGALLKHNQPAQARQLLEAAKSRFSTSAPLYQSLATACYRSGDFQAAYDALQTSLSLDKSSGLSYFLMGCTLSKLGERQAAESHFLRAAALDPRFARPQ